MRTKLLTLMLLAGGTLFAGPRVFFGFGFGGGYGGGYYAPPPPPPYYYSYAPEPRVAYPGPEYRWIGGYWDWSGPRYYWHPGYYARPPFAGAYWYGPRYDRGYWGRR